MANKFIRNGELQDKKIIKALTQATKDYENGAILETRDLLLDICVAINEFEDLQED